MSEASYRILVVDQQDDGFLRILRSVDRHYEVVHKGTVEEALEDIEKKAPHIVIVGASLPKENAEELCLRIRSRGIEQSYIGVIVAVDDFKKPPDSSLMEYADDFLVKNRHLHELRARLHTSFRVTEMATVLREHHLEMLHTNERLSKVSITDELTGLYNMRYFQKRLKQEFVRAKRYGKEMSVLMFDVDKFKSVNDENDHMLGSHVLATIGGIVSQTIRSVDIAARFGGDEYVVLLPETSREGATIFAERLRQGIKQQVFKGKNKDVSVTVSIGVGSLKCDQEITTVEELMKLADQQLYKAKENGRDNVQIC